MSTQAVAPASSPSKPRVRVGRKTTKTPAVGAGAVKSPFERALAASLERRAACVQSIAVKPVSLVNPVHAAASVNPVDFMAAVEPRSSAPLAPVRGVAVPQRSLRALLRAGADACRRLLAGWNARRVAQGVGRLRMVERVSLGEKQAVAILAVHGVQYLVGHGPGGISLLAKLEEAGGNALGNLAEATKPSLSPVEDATSLPVTAPPVPAPIVAARSRRPRPVAQETR